jgi:hypothetical protein
MIKLYMFDKLRHRPGYQIHGEFRKQFQVGFLGLFLL